MRLRVLTFIIMLLLLTSVTLSAEPVDVIILLDVSESVFPIFEDILDYLIRDILQSHLQFGDYFHLLTFAGSAQFELSEQVNSKEDIEKILKRVFLLQPLGKHTDIIGAIQYVYQYAVDLPVSRTKTILMLTDGIHDPPPESPFQPEERDIKREITNSAAQFTNKNWEFRIVLLPEGEKPEGSATVISDLEDALKAEVTDYPEETDETFSNKALGNPTVEAEKDLGKVGRKFTIPIKVTNYDSGTRTFRLYRLYLDGENVLLNNPEIQVEPGETEVLQAEVLLPEGIDPGDQTLTFIPEFRNGQRFSPKEIEVDVQVRGDGLFREGVPWKIILFIFIGLIVLSVLILFIVKFRQSIDTVFTRGAKTAKESLSTYQHFDEHETSPIVELVVEGQNKQIGMRNVHRLSAGHSLCVGGDGSPFIIFLYPFPRCIGRIKNENGSFVFKPVKLDFFPPDSEETVENCLEKRLQAVSQTGKKVTFFFREYISPLEQINRIMRLTKKPGLPG